MKNLIILLLVLHPFFIFSQSGNKLDEKNGFKQFKLGSDISRYSNECEKMDYNNGNGTDVYIFKGSEPTQFLGWKFTQLTLSTYKNKLFQIAITFQTIEIIQFNQLLSDLESTFGNSYVINTSNQVGVLKARQWVGNKVIMQISQSSKDDPLYGKETICVVITEKGAFEKINDANF